ncbi:MAG: LapA family protein [Acidimicrobiia bacterium]|nr:LapA family protein [Acidimicrobiia bacterium]
MAWDDGRDKTDEGTENRFSAGDLARVAPAVVLAIVLIAFAVANTKRVKVNFLVADAKAPLIVVLLATALVGAVIGALLRRRRRD